MTLSGFEETPLTLSSPGSAEFEAQIREHDTLIEWKLSYRDTPTAVQQAHIHFGARAIGGGITIFLCTNLGNAPATVPAPQLCPASPATITGVIREADVIALPAQGIAAGELDEVIAAIRAGAAYVNVHTVERPGGELRGQFKD